MRLGRWTFGGALAGAAATVAMACSGITSSAPPPSSGDGGAGYCPSTSPSTVCADFSGDPVSTAFTDVYGDAGAVSRDTSNFVSAPASAHFLATDVAAFASPICVLRKFFPFATASKVHVELAVRVNSSLEGALVGPKILRTVFRDTAKNDRYEVGLYWGPDSAGIYLAENLLDDKQALLEAGTPAPLPVGSASLGQWHRFSLDLTLSGDTNTPGTGSFAFDDGPPVPFTPPIEVQAFRTAPTFSVGLESCGSAEPLLDYDVDDVVIDVR